MHVELIILVSDGVHMEHKGKLSSKLGQRRADCIMKALTPSYPSQVALDNIQHAPHRVER